MSEPAYDQKCQHCESPIRALNGFYEDAEGWTHCVKNLPHAPMPVVPGRSES